MRIYVRFQDKIDVYKAILVIKDLTCLVGNSSKASMKNDMLDFNVITFFGINTRTGKVFRPLLVRWSFLHQDGLKLTLMGLLGIFWSCYLWRYFPWEYEGVYQCFFLCFLKFRLLWLSFMEL